jgi:hypothetical protein
VISDLPKGREIVNLAREARNRPDRLTGRSGCLQLLDELALDGRQLGETTVR